MMTSISSLQACSLPLDGSNAFCPPDGFLKPQIKQTKRKFIEKPIYNKDFSWRENPYEKESKIIQSNQVLGSIKEMIENELLKYQK